MADTSWDTLYTSTNLIIFYAPCTTTTNVNHALLKSHPVFARSQRFLHGKNNASN